MIEINIIVGSKNIRRKKKQIFLVVISAYNLKSFVFFALV